MFFAPFPPGFIFNKKSNTLLKSIKLIALIPIYISGKFLYLTFSFYFCATKSRKAIVSCKKI